MATSKLRKILLLVETICAIEKTNGVPKKKTPKIRSLHHCRHIVPMWDLTG